MAPQAPLDYTAAVTALSSTASSLTVPLPACSPGHLLILAAVGGAPAQGAINPTQPSGWATQGSNTAARLGVWTRTATTADAAPGAAIAVPFSAAGALAAVCLSYPAAAVSAFTHTAGSLVPAPSYSTPFVTGAAAGQTVLCFAAARSDQGVTDGGSGCAPFNLPPAPYVWLVPPVGPSFVNTIVNGTQVPGLGVAAVAAPGPISTVVTSPVLADWFSSFLALNITGAVPNWLRVTATGGAGAGSGTVLDVRAVTGSALPAIPVVAVKSAKTSATPDVQLTPAATGSWVYGAAFENAAAAVFTPDAGTTLRQNFRTVSPAADTPGSYGTFRTGATTAGTPVTAGASAPSGASGTDVAAVEIPAALGSSLAEVGVAQAAGLAPGDYRHAAPSQTAIFTQIPGGSRLIATVAQGYQINRSWLGPPTVKLSDSAGLTWTELARANGTGYAGVWTALVP